MPVADKTLSCRDCAMEFTFTTTEQEFFATKGFMNEPSRCPDCRAARKARQASATPSPSSFGRGLGSLRSFPRLGGASREMHPAVCSECGSQTRVPFAPRGDKPVYCSSCYDRVRGPRRR